MCDVEPLFAVLRMPVRRGDSSCVEASKDIYAVAIKERSAKRAERSDASLFDDSVDKLRR